MDCARCGHSSGGDSTRCERCGASLAPAGAPGSGLSAEPSSEAGPAASTILLDSASTPSAGRAGVPGVATTSGATNFGDPRLFGQGPLAVGQPFGPRYQILRVLGVGGMGAVYQAWDAALGVAVALKVIRTDHRQVTAEIEQRFKNELLLARQVTHKSVVRIHDLGEIDGIKYITMPYVDGQDLATLLRAKGTLPLATTLQVARQMADGLQAAHEAGVASSRPQAGERHAVDRRRDPCVHHGFRDLDFDRACGRRAGARHARIHAARAGDGRTSRCPR